MGEIKVKLTDAKGQTRYVYPQKVDATISENAATEVTLEFNNARGLNTNIMKYKDIIEIEWSP